MIEYAREERSCALSGYSGRTTEVTVELVSFDRRQRQRRAWLGLASWWAVAAATAFIPVAHFLLVPGFLAFGLFSFARRAQIAVVAVSARGGCPDCGAEQEFDLPARWSVPLTVTCERCARSLRLDAGEPGGVEGPG